MSEENKPNTGSQHTTTKSSDPKKQGRSAVQKKSK